MDRITVDVRKGEYLDPQTNLVCCKKCGEPRQTVKIVLGRKYTPRVLCKCEAHASEVTTKNIIAENRMFNSKHLASARFQSPLLNMNRREEDLGFNPDSLITIENYAADWENKYSHGSGLLFFGPIGSGKSFLAARLGNTLIDKGVTVLMIDCDGLDKRFFGIPLSEQSSLIESVNGFDLLILDNLDVALDNKHSTEYINLIVSTRWAANKPMIVTTNKTPPMMRALDFKQKRICEILLECCEPHMVDGENIRQVKAKELVRAAKKAKAPLEP